MILLFRLRVTQLPSGMIADVLGCVHPGLSLVVRNHDVFHGSIGAFSRKIPRVINGWRRLCVAA
jgi:hypothetical protein